jgi:hypothetical protein
MAAGVPSVVFLGDGGKLLENCGKEYKGNLKYDWRFAMPSLEKISHEYWNYFGSRLPVPISIRTHFRWSLHNLVYYKI